MKNFKIAVLITLGVIVAGWSGYAVYTYVWNRPANCEIRFRSTSDVVRVEVVDMAKFREFVSQYIPCEEGYFLGNREGVQWGTKKYKILEFWVDDNGYKRTVKGRNSSPVFSYGISDVKPGVMGVLLQFDQSLVAASTSAEHDFSKTMPFAVAAGANLWQVGENGKIIDGSEESKFTLEKSGLSYEALIK